MKHNPFPHDELVASPATTRSTFVSVSMALAAETTQKLVDVKPPHFAGVGLLFIELCRHINIDPAAAISQIAAAHSRGEFRCAGDASHLEARIDTLDAPHITYLN